eukprot:c34967_g1_i1 orf=3-194(-)
MVLSPSLEKDPPQFVSHPIFMGKRLCNENSSLYFLAKPSSVGRKAMWLLGVPSAGYFCGLLELP